MLALTRKTDYAVLALADLASKPGRLVRAREIAQELGVPEALLINILKQLRQYGLVASSRGPRGGYCLARPPEEITLVQLIEAVEGPIRLTQCCHEHGDVSEARCELEPSCRVREPVRRVHDSLQRFLAQVTLAQIANDTVPVQVTMFTSGAAADARPLSPAGT